MKKILTIIIILVFIFISIIIVKSVSKYISDKFWSVVVNQLDKEEVKRKQIIENGGLVAGKDTVLIWGSKYQIYRNDGYNNLSIHIDKQTDELILEKVTNYKIKDSKLYIISAEGYAIIAEDNLCRVFVTVPQDEFVNGFTTDEFGKKNYISRKIESDYITYLSQYEDFNKDEIAYLSKIINTK